MRSSRQSQFSAQCRSTTGGEECLDDRARASAADVSPTRRCRSLLAHKLVAPRALTGSEQLRVLHAGSEGCIGVLSDWIWTAVHVASTHRRKLTSADLRGCRSWVLADSEDFRKRLHDGESAAALAGHRNPYASTVKRIGATVSRGGEIARQDELAPTEALRGVITESAERRPPIGETKLRDMRAFEEPVIGGA